MSRAHHITTSDHAEEQGTTMSTATEISEASMTAETEFSVTAEMIAVDRIHAAGNVRNGKLPNIPSLAESIEQTAAQAGRTSH